MLLTRASRGGKPHPVNPRPVIRRTLKSNAPRSEAAVSPALNRLSVQRKRKLAPNRSQANGDRILAIQREAQTRRFGEIAYFTHDASALEFIASIGSDGDGSNIVVNQVSCPEYPSHTAMIDSSQKL